jgi:hypothetical protein
MESEIERAKFEKAVEDYNDNWRKADGILYAMCRDCKEHTSAENVNAKVLIIGRSYASGIERAVASNGGQASALTRVTTRVLANGSKLDAICDELRSIEDPLTVDKLRIIVQQHARFLEVLHGLGKNVPRSFASKYLHFHAPVVPVYDSYADARLTTLVPWQTKLKEFDAPERDDLYYWFVCRFWRVYRAVHERFPSATVKEIDAYLLWNPKASV